MSRGNYFFNPLSNTFRSCTSNAENEQTNNKETFEMNVGNLNLKQLVEGMNFSFTILRPLFFIKVILNQYIES